MEGILYLEDGTVYRGKGFGKIGTSSGELVFNTSITGYQEILTDPSYAGQVITMTYPLIGNYGVNRFENESDKISARGLVVKNVSKIASNYMSEMSIQDMLTKMNIVGISDVDTRSITRKIRSVGAQKCVISNEDISINDLKELILKEKNKADYYVDEVSIKEPLHISGNGPRVVVMDFGVKKNIINNLKARNCDITILPYDASYEEIESLRPDGVFLSNGPGDPKTVTEAIDTVKKVIEVYPTFGICLGHQILALALGGDTYKMKYGHRGGNHGVYDIYKDKAYITSQNHGYAVSAESLSGKEVEITHINLNDNTVEGLQHKELPVFSVQFHPEGAAGPTDTSYLFDKFVNMTKYCMCK
ncbi:glutamine-hydrolyzing carbamoyl-phosphate synthase small subunit [Clostridium sp. 19966]|uniref:glutamine-hydrolyzing carbamoyl-phosphate synthase small subunit n=1 Tax=Clostridium sp. 19966 TaxID=2768166 RepID=UPI0028DF43D2|nr:glutamine-hydrolyzing carbamoyl-phosphate synthase small subunit [Clostridium sp. 19966]MDT8719379.1 glutamine-hydrolyzing carbamoyl-phosphate synthase small subunit [Clostridium sp. 19966]